MRQPYYYLLLPLAACSGFALLWAVLPAPQHRMIEHRATEMPATELRQINQRIQADARLQQSVPPALPAGLAGASHGVQLVTDAQGHLHVDEGLLRLFEFYLLALQDESVAQVLARIHHELTSQLQQPALNQARELLQRYIDYRLALQTLPALAETADLPALQARAEALQRLRERYFSQSEVQALFARDQAEEQHVLRHLQAQAVGASPAELAALDEQLPDDLREARRQATLPGELYAQVSDLRSQGASDEQVYQLRAQALGTEAADELAKLDAQRAHWQTRLRDFTRERLQLDQAGLAEEDRQAEYQALLSRHFAEHERVRVQALSEAGLLPGE